MVRKSSFPPVVAPDTRVLVLGSLPGERSLAARRYYAHPPNRFWHPLGKGLGGELGPLEYEQRLITLRTADSGLWDTVATARRAGSLDAAIREVEHNALAGLAASLPELRAVGFNGRTSARIGIPQLAGANLALV